jgi:hypothetical protein
MTDLSSSCSSKAIIKLTKLGTHHAGRGLTELQHSQFRVSFTATKIVTEAHKITSHFTTSAHQSDTSLRFVSWKAQAMYSVSVKQLSSSCTSDDSSLTGAPPMLVCVPAALLCSGSLRPLCWLVLTMCFYVFSAVHACAFAAPKSCSYDHRVSAGICIIALYLLCLCSYAPLALLLACTRVFGVLSSCTPQQVVVVTCSELSLRQHPLQFCRDGVVITSSMLQGTMPPMLARKTTSSSHAIRPQHHTW